MLVAARQYTLAIYAHLTPEQLAVPRRQGVNLPLWELAHVGWFQEYWCRRARPGRPPLPSRYPHFDDWYDSSVVPHATRWTLAHPPMREILQQLAATFDDAMAALESAPEEKLYPFGLAALHEFMHAEAFLMTLHTLALPAPPRLAQSSVASHARAAAGRARVANDDIECEGGAMALGTAPGAAHFIFDNEKWAHPVEVTPFAIATGCVPNREFAAFVDDGGYRSASLWTADGREWLARTNARHPSYWRREGDTWLARRFDEWTVPDADAPVMHVNLHEAMAWCAWSGRRLPTEAEWEWAARRGGDGRYPWGDDPALLDACALGARSADPLPASNAGPAFGPLRHLLGNAWEWTASPFRPYPGFAADPYLDYSEPWFGNHQVIRGGSLFTAPALVHNRFRNFYLPERADMFVGFRTCARRA